MKLYLSSYKIGNNGLDLRRLFLNNPRVGYIPNALDFKGVNQQIKKDFIKSDTLELSKCGLEVEILDLKEYFNNNGALQERLKKLGGVWVIGGNVFVLRQAMYLSGLDKLLKNVPKDFVYGGYSAGPCVLSPNLKAYEIVDDGTNTPYDELDKVIWDGLGMIDFVFLPHFKSDHPESEGIDKEVEYCKENKIKYKTLSDGEVIIVEN